MLMQTPPALIELSFADALSRARIGRLKSRKHPAPVALFPAADREGTRPPARAGAGAVDRVRIPVGRLHHHPLGITPKTLANHRANVKAALRWFTGETGGPARGAPAERRLGETARQHRKPGARARLYGLMRFCSAKQIAPSGISDAVLESYLAYRIATSSLAGGVGAHRLIARTWNTCAHLPPRLAGTAPHRTRPAIP